MHKYEVNIEDMKIFIFRRIENVPEKVFCSFKCMAEISGFVVKETVVKDRLVYFPMLPMEISQRKHDVAMECLENVIHHKVYDCLSVRPAILCMKSILKEPFLFQYPESRGKFLNNSLATSCLLAHEVRMKELIIWRNGVDDEASPGLQKVFLCILNNSILREDGSLDTGDKLMRRFPVKSFIGVNQAVYRGIKRHLDELGKVVTPDDAKEAFRFLRYYMSDESLPRVEYAKQVLQFHRDDTEEPSSLSFDDGDDMAYFDKDYIQ